jgi:hypothetical protein
VIYLPQPSPAYAAPSRWRQVDCAGPTIRVHANWPARQLAVVEEEPALEVPTWRETREEAVASPWPMLMANGVGGSTLHYEAVSFHFLPWNFATHSLALARYGSSAIPADSTVADWPCNPSGP